MAVESSVRLRVDGTSAVSALRKVNTATVGVTKSVGLLTTALRAIPFIGVADAARRFFKGFADAENAAAAVRTLGVDSERLQKKLLGVTAELKGQVGQTELLAASYDVASAGFNDAASAADILKAASLGAKGGLSDLNTVADATTSVLNAYGLTSDKAAKLVDGFIQTQNDGKIVVAQYAQQIGRVAPVAAAAGVGIEDLNAAISTVTAQGVPIESTFAGIRQIIAGVLKPTAEAAKVAETLGIEFNTAAIKAKGFGGFLADVVQKTGGSEVALTQLFGSVEAISALLPLTNDGLVSFNENLENQAKSAGAAKNAANELGGTVTSQLTAIFNNVGTLSRQIDTKLGPALSGVLGKVQAVTSEFIKFFALLAEGPSTLSIFQANLSSFFGAQSQGVDNLVTAVQQLGSATISSEDEAVRFEAQIERISASLSGLRKNTTTQQLFDRGLIDNIRTIVKELDNLRDKVDAARAKGFSSTNGDGNGATVVNPLQAQIDALLAQLAAKEGGSTQLTDAQRLVETLKAQKKTLEEQTLLAAGKTAQDRRRIQLNIDLNNLEAIRTDENAEIVDQVRDATQALFDQQVQTENNKQADRDRADALKKQQDAEKKRAEELRNVYQGIGDTIADGVVDALKGAVNGTQSLAEAATNMLNDLANQMLQLARNMLFFGNITGTLTKGGGLLGSLFGGFMANGGTTMPGKSYVVGEKGPELFTPGRTGSIAPNDAFGGANIVVNVDASGSSVEGNAQESKALGQALGAAVKAELIKQKMPGGLLA